MDSRWNGVKRTHYCGELNERHEGERVLLQGWVNRRRDLGGLVFLDLRDRTGLVQVVVDPESPAFAEAERVRGEYVLEIEGTVRARPADQVNPELATGRVEVAAARLEVLNEAATPPFPVDASWRGEDDPAERVNEDLRLKYRYLDLRRKPMLDRLRLRHTVIKAIWDFLSAEGFVQVETPFLTRSTPEGARDFLVPSRLEPGKFYALPQSPQLFKQMLMIAGVDRYFQIARCFRDEDLRADRQPDFTQLDLEMSFVSQEDIWAINERLVAHVFREALGVELPLPSRACPTARRWSATAPTSPTPASASSLSPRTRSSRTRTSTPSAACWRPGARCAACGRRPSSRASRSRGWKKWPSATAPRGWPGSRWARTA